MVSFLDGHVVYQKVGELGRGFSQYNIPTRNSYYMDFSSVTFPTIVTSIVDPVARQTAEDNWIDANTQMGKGWCDLTWSNGNRTTGKYDEGMKAWKLASAASDILAPKPIAYSGPQGMSISVEYTCAASAGAMVWCSSSEGTDGNIANQNPIADGSDYDDYAGFGCYNPVNPAGQHLADAYTGMTSNVLPKNGTSFRIQTAMGYLAPAQYPPTADSVIARNSDGSEYTFTPPDPGGMLIPTPLKAKIEELAPTYGVSSYSGLYLTWRYQTNSFRCVSPLSGPIYITKLFISN